jgi:hypothetical protein
VWSQCTQRKEREEAERDKKTAFQNEHPGSKFHGFVPALYKHREGQIAAIGSLRVIWHICHNTFLQDCMPTVLQPSFICLFIQEDALPVSIWDLMLLIYILVYAFVYPVNSS